MPVLTTRSGSPAQAALERLGLETLLASPGLERLDAIRFLGGLYRERHQDSRLDHTLGVAGLTAVALEHLSIAEDVQRHALVAALLHDSSQWALSHSAEGAFGRLSGLSNHQIVDSLLGESSELGPNLALGPSLVKLKIDPPLVLALLRKDTELERLGEDWARALHLARFPFNPDNLDGISRAARIAGLACPAPERVLIEALAAAPSEEQLDAFWKTKAQVYDTFLHGREPFLQEVRLSLAVFDRYAGRSRAFLFGLTDEYVLHDLQGKAPTELDPNELALGCELRFRRPRRYLIDGSVRLSTPHDLNLRYRSEERNDLGGDPQNPGRPAGA